MRILIFFLAGIFAVAAAHMTAHAAEFVVVQDEFVWRSSTLVPVSEPETTAGQAQHVPPAELSIPLGDLAYNRYFDSHGAPPPLDFLRPLEKNLSALARIEGRRVRFAQTGREISLNLSRVPSWADPATPYLLSSPTARWVLVVYPYYFYQCKDNRYFVEAYSEDGRLLYTFDSLPSHVVAGDSDLLVAPEKSGCCDSLKWSFRFYNIRTGAVTELACPEGFCGDVLFVQLSRSGPFAVVQEIAAAVSGVGESLQTNIHIVDRQGAVIASGKIIHAIRSREIQKDHIGSRSPYSLSKLVSIEPAGPNTDWCIQFADEGQRSIFKMIGRTNDLTPGTQFLLLKAARSGPNSASVEIDRRMVGKLPLLAVADPGHYTLRFKGANGQADKVDIQVRSDWVNIRFF
jgi:hypothetical protein